MGLIQALQLASVYAVAGLLVLLQRERLGRRLAHVDEAPLPVKLALGSSAGALLALPLGMLAIDVVPDQLEAAAALLLGSLLAGGALLLVHERA